MIILTIYFIIYFSNESEAYHINDYILVHYFLNFLIFLNDNKAINNIEFEQNFIHSSQLIFLKSLIILKN